MENESNQNFIPDVQDAQSLMDLAKYFKQLSEQLEFASRQLGRTTGVEVPATKTFKKGMTYVESWFGNLFPAVSRASMEAKTVDEINQKALKAAEHKPVYHAKKKKPKGA